MSESLIKTKILAVCFILCLPVVYSQRPSYAGSRPPNGHKDKYRPTQNPQTVQLANRFSDNTLENGATQRPPQGVPLVHAEPAFIPISSSKGSNSLSKDEQPNKSAQSLPDVSNRSGSITSNPRSPTPPLPLDAHGDQQLIDHLARLPIDQQPFWFINYQAIEAHRNSSVNNFGPIASRSSFLGK